MANITILGAGGWGTALAVMSHRHGHRVSLWTPFAAECAAIRTDGQHTRLLPGVPVSPDIALTAELSAALEPRPALILLTVPSFATVETARRLGPLLPAGSLVVNAGKGLDRESGRRFSELLSECLPDAAVVVLSGPSHAEEVAVGKPASVVCSGTKIDAAAAAQDILMNQDFRIYITSDVVGVELGGALKNIIALAAGICDGMQMGDNAKAALITRGLTEMMRLGVAMGAAPATFAGLSGLGDLVVTCGSVHSRNRRAGMLIGQGHTPRDAVARVGTVEGFLAAETGYKLAKQAGVEMPITEQCYRICYENQPPRQALGALMERPKRHETETHWLGE